MDIEKIIDNIVSIDYSSIDIDEFLDNRDSKAFEIEWMHIYNQIDKDKIPSEIKE